MDANVNTVTKKTNWTPHATRAGSQAHRFSSRSTMQQQEPPAQDELSVPPDLSQLPADFLVLLMARLPLQDMLAASATCQHLHNCCEQVWQEKCRARWQHCACPCSSMASLKEWRSLYQQRHQADSEVFQLLEAACFPDLEQQAHSRLMEIGEDAVDVLSAIAHSSARSSLFVGMAYQARMALHYIRGDQAAQKLQRLLQRHQEQGGSAGGSVIAGRASESLAAAAVASAAEALDVNLLLEGALLLAQVLHPLSDVAAVRRAVDGLAAELRTRMAAAGVVAGSRQAMELLNGLMFGPPATSEGGSHDSSSAGAGSSSREGQRDEDLDGPDLSGLVLPTDGISGLGLRGNDRSYYNPRNSCLDSVLASRAGLPISLSLLYAAVGRGAGLRVSLANMPAHVLSCVWVSDEEGRPGEVLYVDAFQGGAVMSEQLLSSFARLRAADQPEADGDTATMSFPAGIARMLRNVLYPSSHWWDMPERTDSSPMSDCIPALLQIQLIGVVMMVMDLPGPKELSVILSVLMRGGADCGGDVLLLRRLASRLPAALSTQLALLQSAIGDITGKKASWRDRVHSRSALQASCEPGSSPLAHHVGDVLSPGPAFGGSQSAGPLVVVGWMARGQRFSQSSPLAARRAALGQHSSSSLEVITWTPGTTTVLPFDAAEARRMCDGSDADEQRWAAGMVAYGEERRRQLLRLRQQWFEPNGGLAPSWRQQEEPAGSWYEVQLRYGRLLEAWWWHEGRGHWVGNPYLRALYPER